MVFSELLIKYPYKAIWQVANLFRKEKNVQFFVAEELDYAVFRNVRKHLPNIELIAKNRKIQNILLAKYNEKSRIYPAFPNVVIMARHALHYFPEEKIKKIGMRHGPYHFKDFISPKKYNRFDMFLLTSDTEVQEAQAIGITSGVTGGFPKSDSLFQNISLTDIKEKKINNNKPVLLFSSTWNKSGLAGVNFWYDKLHLFTEKYNVFVTLHPWVSAEYVEKIRQTEDVHFIGNADLTDYLLLADVLISDTSSIIAEYFLLDKPVVTFEIEQQGRLSQAIIDMLAEATLRIKDIDELDAAITKALQNPAELSTERKKYVRRMFAPDLGNHGLLAATKIAEFVNGC